MREVDCEEFNIVMLVSIETLVVVHCPYYVNYDITLFTAKQQRQIPVTNLVV
jgi:hypothetical protein